MHHCVDASQGQRNDTFGLSRAIHFPSSDWVRSSFVVGRVTTVKRTSRRPSGSRGRRHRPRRWGGDAARQIGGDGLVGDGWVEWGGELIWAVGFTDGGAPFGLSISGFDPADLEAMGLASTSLSRIDGPGGWLPEPDAGPGSDEVGARVARGHAR